MSLPKVLTATLLCDRKKYSQNVAPPALFKLKYPNNTLYFNIETEDYDANYQDLQKMIEANPDKSVEIDTWKFQSTWWKKPAFDQDQARLVPICTARNMAIDCASLTGCDYLFFVDADVIPSADSIERLMAHDRPIVSGTVPGRGAHSHGSYIFHPRGYPKPNVVNTAHATCGYTLIKREVFELLRFRQGPHPIHKETHLSEDPAYGADMECIWKFCDGWWVDLSLLAAHVDNLNDPLTLDKVAQF